MTHQRTPSSLALILPLVLCSAAHAQPANTAPRAAVLDGVGTSGATFDDLLKSTGLEKARLRDLTHEMLSARALAVRNGVYYRSDGTNRSVVSSRVDPHEFWALHAVKAAKAGKWNDLTWRSGPLNDRPDRHREVLSLLIARNRIVAKDGIYRPSDLGLTLALGRDHVTMPWYRDRAQLNRTQRQILAALSHHTQAERSFTGIQELTYIRDDKLRLALEKLEARGVVVRVQGEGVLSVYRLAERRADATRLPRLDVDKLLKGAPPSLALTVERPWMLEVASLNEAELKMLTRLSGKTEMTRSELRGELRIGLEELDRTAGRLVDRGLLKISGGGAGGEVSLRLAKVEFEPLRPTVEDVRNASHSSYRREAWMADTKRFTPDQVRVLMALAHGAGAEGRSAEALARRAGLPVERVERTLGELSRRFFPVVDVLEVEGEKRYRTRAKADLFARYRDPVTKTIAWKRLTADRAKHEAGGLLHFGLALFLKELALVAATGDRERIEAFFDGLLTTDFYKHYGLFMVGARGADIAYSRYLKRFVRPRFVSGLLRTNLVLAAGMALPEIVEGRFEGRTFAISLGSLGLSSAVVHAGLSQIPWVKRMRRMRGLATATRVARAGAWFYTAAELAVILIAAEKIEEEVTEYLDERAARKRLAEAAEEFHSAIGHPRANRASVDNAARRYRAAWDAYRAFLYRPFSVQERELMKELAKAARAAKIAEDRAKALEVRLASLPSLRRNLEARRSDAATRRDREVHALVDRTLAKHGKEFEAKLDALYTEGRRDGAFLGEDPLEELGVEGLGERNDLYARKARARAAADFAERHRKASSNRPQTFEDELAGLNLAADDLRARGAGEAERALRDHIAFVKAMAAADRKLHTSGTVGAVGNLEEAR